MGTQKKVKQFVDGNEGKGYWHYWQGCNVRNKVGISKSF